mmetsp:Transcript_14531/g.60636  ORF Transcript_14531/g.60636 Transcript_14531/m.60636 type:complete len:250 (+) Transcript_14531:368-1117(+)
MRRTSNARRSRSFRQSPSGRSASASSCSRRAEPTTSPVAPAASSAPPRLSLKRAWRNRLSAPSLESLATAADRSSVTFEGSRGECASDAVRARPCVRLPCDPSYASASSARLRRREGPAAAADAVRAVRVALAPAPASRSVLRRFDTTLATRPPSKRASSSSLLEDKRLEWRTSSSALSSSSNSASLFSSSTMKSSRSSSSLASLFRCAPRQRRVREGRRRGASSSSLSCSPPSSHPSPRSSSLSPSFP